MATIFSTDRRAVQFIKLWWNTQGPRGRLPKSRQGWRYMVIDGSNHIRTGPVPIDIREGCETLDEAVVAVAHRWGREICSEVVRCDPFCHVATWAIGNEEFCAE